MNILNDPLYVSIIMISIVLPLLCIIATKTGAWLADMTNEREEAPIPDDPNDKLHHACESGMQGHGSSYIEEYRTYTVFVNGHIEYTSERENMLIRAAYKQGREHEALNQSRLK